MKSFFKKIADGFRKTREVVAEGIQQVLQQHKQIDPELYDDLESVLLRGDVGPATTAELLQRLKRKVKEDGLEDPVALRPALRQIVEDILRGRGLPAATAAKAGAAVAATWDLVLAPSVVVLSS